MYRKSLFQLSLGNRFYLSWIFLMPFPYQIHSPPKLKNVFISDKNSDFSSQVNVTTFVAPCTPFSLRNSQLNCPSYIRNTGAPCPPSTTRTYGCFFIWPVCMFRDILNQNNQLFILKHVSIAIIFKIQRNNGKSGEAETHAVKLCRILFYRRSGRKCPYMTCCY